MFGKRIAKQTLRWLRRRDFTLLSALAGVMVICLIIYAMFDFVQTARTRGEQIQTSVLHAELAQFLLSTREEDGASLLDSPADYASAHGRIRVVPIQKNFYSYILNAQNARNFKAENVRLEPPRSCITEFPVSDGNPIKSMAVRICFAVPEQDYTGRFIYFSIAYPAPPIRRYVRGSELADASQVLLRLRGERDASLLLVFEAPALALARYPSQMRRFSAVHEITAYPLEDPSRPTNVLRAQAYQSALDDTALPGNTYITILGRLDSSLVYRSADAVSSWPFPAVRKLEVAVSAIAGGKDAPQLFEIPFGATGDTLASLEKIYFSQIRSHARLTIQVDAPGKNRARQALWSSSSLSTKSEARRVDIFQQLSDLWAEALLRVFSEPRKAVSVEQQLPGRRLLKATLTSEPEPLPDLANRAVAWLLIALICVLGLGYIWARTWSRLDAITRKAYRLTVTRSASGNLDEYRKRSDEIGTLGRTFNLLIKRVRLNAERLKRQQQLRSEQIRLQDARVRARQVVLDAIGHEIKSPLESLVAKAHETGAIDPNLERMRRAVEALYEATSVESGLRSGDIVLKRADIAAYLSKLAANYSERDLQVRYAGKSSGISASFDAVELHVVIDHILNNALRYRSKGSQILIGLDDAPTGAVIQIFNDGPRIPEEDLERIFEYGVTAQDSGDNRGQGLFIARLRMIAMLGYVAAENREGGVAFVITLPTAPQEGGA